MCLQIMRCTKKVGRQRKRDERKRESPSRGAGASEGEPRKGPELPRDVPAARGKHQNGEVCGELVPPHASPRGGVRVREELVGAAFVPSHDIARHPRIAIFAGELRPSRLPRVNVPHVGIRLLFGSYGREGVGADGPPIGKGADYGKDREVDKEPGGAVLIRRPGEALGSAAGECRRG